MGAPLPPLWGGQRRPFVGGSPPVHHSWTSVGTTAGMYGSIYAVGSLQTSAVPGTAHWPIERLPACRGVLAGGTHAAAASCADKQMGAGLLRCSGQPD